MKKLKILLSDPRHDTVGAHSNYIPIGIGYIGAYLKEKLKDKVDLELYLTTKPEETLSLIEKKKPDIVGISNYIWNSSLSNSIYGDYGNDKIRAFGRFLMQYVGRGVDILEKDFQRLN